MTARSRLLVSGGIVLLLGDLAYLGHLVGLQDCAEVQLAMKQATADPRIVASLGAPVDKGWIWHGSREGPFAVGGGRSEIVIPLHGPRGEGTLRVEIWNDIGVLKLRGYQFTAPDGSQWGDGPASAEGSR